MLFKLTKSYISINHRFYIWMARIFVNFGLEGRIKRRENRIRNARGRQRVIMRYHRAHSRQSTHSEKIIVQKCFWSFKPSFHILRFFFRTKFSNTSHVSSLAYHMVQYDMGHMIWPISYWTISNLKLEKFLHPYYMGHIIWGLYTGCRNFCIFRYY